MENASTDHADSDICKCGYLRKQKSMHRRFFVLRAGSDHGPCRLEYYENEKKFRCKGAIPKRSLNLETCLSISKRADLRNKHLIVIYTKDESFVLGVEGEAEQQCWFQAMVDLQCKSKLIPGSKYGGVIPGPAFKEVWQVSLRPRGLGQARNLVGIYRLCLTEKTISFVRLNSDAAAVVLQLMNIRRCGHSDNYFFIEMGRSAVTGPGEFWMQVEDSVVAQNMHETILEAMKAMSEEVRLRSKSQSLSSNPISVPSRRHHANPPPSQVGFPRRSRTETMSNTSPTPKHSFHRPRTSSDGNGSACRPKSHESSPANSTPTLKQKSQKNPGVPKPQHPPLNHTQSTPAPSVRCPVLQSPVSLSSGSTTVNGSDCVYTRASSSSISESPSDYCFTSSDEYGSSPSDSRHSCIGRSITPDSLSYITPSLDDSNGNYIAMGKRTSVAEEAHCQRRILRRASSREGETDRGLSKRASLPPMALGKLTPSMPRKREEYTVMSRTASRESFTAPSKGVDYPYTEGSDVTDELHRQNRKNCAVTDNGYMTMLPGVVPTQNKNDDYMPMTPNSVSPPRQIVSSRSEANGYMVMSPNGSCSPDSAVYQRSWVSAEKLSVGSNDSKMSGSDYMNMSPLSRSASSTPPDSGIPEEAPKMVYAYYSLPRSYKQATAKFKDSQFNPSVSTVHLSYSSSASSDSLGDQNSTYFSVPPVPAQIEDQARKSVKSKRPVSLFIDVSKASTLPRVRETPLPPEPKSPGEYVSIEFRRSSGTSWPNVRSNSSIGNFHELSETNMSSEYVTMELGNPVNLSQYAKTPLTTSQPKRNSFEHINDDCMTVKVGDSCPFFSDYTDMAFSMGTETPKSSSPKEEEVSIEADNLMDHMSHMGTFTIPKLGSNPNQGAKVIRADQQGRRRHCSETFLSVPTTVGSLSLPFADHTKRHSSASSENVWAKGEHGATGGTEERPVSISRQMSTALEHGLNYIDLDLVKDSSLAGSLLPARHCTLLQGISCSTDLSLYASIDFHKSQELRNQKNNDDGTVCDLGMNYSSGLAAKKDAYV
ncbi:insulin receptor substrate 1-B-like [Protopterus annectens]|uniref:insulin receptor substrate 1-B-like n=1 Tax=Protopterus annectens TaxID=7888 RepID=UPI001CF9DE07|nr:insulin receptor substrate 1-B-like [Protopterus annectens]